MRTASRLRAWLAAGAVTALGAAAVSNCEGAATERAPVVDAGGGGFTSEAGATGFDAPGGGGGYSANDARTEAETSTLDAPEAGEAGACAAPAPNPDVPAGWYAWQGWSCDCPLYLPGPNAAPVAPVTWEPCPSPPVDASLGCRRMAVTWTTNRISTTSGPGFGIDPATGAPLLQFGRNDVKDNPNVRYRLVASADGPVRIALLEIRPPNQGCELLNNQDVNEGRWAFMALGDESAGSLYGTREGVIAGRIDDATPERVLGFAQTPGLTRDWYVSTNWLVEVFHTWSVRSWTSDTPTTIYDPAKDAQQLPGHTTRAVGSDVFIEVGAGVNASAVYGEMVWSPSAGLQPLLRWPNDPSESAGCFGTDGKDMVWTYAKQRTLSVMTAKYTTDPSTVASSERRLCADPAGSFPLPLPWVVGCGYAAHRLYTVGGTTNDLFVVRLKDGAAWLLRGNSDPGALSYTSALGITCSDIFATAQFMDNPAAIIRIRVSNLGAPLPPS